MSNNFSHLSTSQIQNYVTLTEYFGNITLHRKKFLPSDLLIFTRLIPHLQQTQRKTVLLSQASFQVQVENFTKLET